MIPRQRAEPHQRRRYRNLSFFAQFPQGRLRSPSENSTADIKNRTFGRIDHFESRFQSFLRWFRRKTFLSPTWFRPCIDFASCHLNIFWNIDQHRPWTSGSGDTKGFGNDFEQFFDRANQVIVLRNRNAQSVSIDLLKSIGADQIRGYLSGDTDQRNTVHPRIGDRRKKICDAGTRRCKTDRRLSRNARHSLSNKTATLFVAGQNVTDLVACEKRIIDRQIGTARHTGDDAHALPLEKANGDFRTCVGFHFLLSVLCRQVKGRDKKTPPRRCGRVLVEEIRYGLTTRYRATPPDGDDDDCNDNGDQKINALARKRKNVVAADHLKIKKFLKKIHTGQHPVNPRTNKFRRTNIFSVDSSEP